MSTSTRYHAVVKGFCGEVEADRQSFRLGQEEKEETIVANELTDREYLGMVRGEIVWNPHTDQWEKRHFDGSHPWWILGIDHSDSYPDSPVALPKQPPPSHDSLPSHEAPGGLTHNQLIRIQQINDLASRGVLTDAARDEEVNRITSEDH
jgi:hypothetical protein